MREKSPAAGATRSGGSPAQVRLTAEVDALRAKTAAIDIESLPLDQDTLAAAEQLHRAVLELDATVCEARNALLGRAVQHRWTYQRIAQATGLSVARIGQLAPPRPRA